VTEEIRKAFGADEASPVRAPTSDSLEAYLPGEGLPAIREIVLSSSISLKIIDGPSGPILQIRAPRIVLEAEDTLELRAGTVCIKSLGDLAFEARRIETEATERTTSISGADRLEAGVIEAQASEGALSLKAQGPIALDGEHIGLNDDPCPRPFSWSQRAQEIGHGE